MHNGLSTKAKGLLTKVQATGGRTTMATTTVTPPWVFCFVLFFYNPIQFITKDAQQRQTLWQQRHPSLFEGYFWLRMTTMQPFSATNCWQWPCFHLQPPISNPIHPFLPVLDPPTTCFNHLSPVLTTYPPFWTTYPPFWPPTIHFEPPTIHFVPPATCFEPLTTLTVEGGFISFK